MKGLRPRWSALMKGGAAGVATLAAILILPGLLEPPAPPPIARDVGLPSAWESRPPARRTRAPAGPATRKAPRQLALGEARIAARAPAARRRGQRRDPAPTAPEPAAAPAPPPAATVAPPAPTAPAAPAVPGDGSEEFAPH